VSAPLSRRPRDQEDRHPSASGRQIGAFLISSTIAAIPVGLGDRVHR
jgi:hypothetical protein